MKANPECIPCQTEAALKTLRKATHDEGLIEEVMMEVLRVLLRFGYGVPPPRVFREIMRLIKERTGNPDPYKGEKEAQNQRALALYPSLKERVRRARDPLYEALLLSSGGNLMDAVASGGTFSPEALPDGFLIDHYPLLREALEGARMVMVIGDNAGEAVMDKVLLEEVRARWPEKGLRYAVRGYPTLNDVTASDLSALGISEVCEVVTTGDDTPGVSLDLSSPEFRRAFEEVDLIIAKGQGNFETLEELGDRRIFFLLWAKCEPIIRHLGLEGSGPVLLRSSP